MENKINIAELLKDCPEGMELDCAMYDKVSLFSVNNNEDIIFPIRVCREDGNLIALTKYGQYTNANFAKCVIFPKGKTTWDGFVPPCKFKDGDIVASLNLSIYIFINCSSVVYGYFFAPCGLIADRNSENHVFKAGTISISVDNMRLATEEEKQKLFDAIKANGYNWNTETKTLEKLLEFKDGDIVISNLGSIHILKNSTTSYCYIDRLGLLDKSETTCVRVMRLATEEENRNYLMLLKQKAISGMLKRRL